MIMKTQVTRMQSNSKSAWPGTPCTDNARKVRLVQQDRQWREVTSLKPWPAEGAHQPSETVRTSIRKPGKQHATREAISVGTRKGWSLTSMPSGKPEWGSVNSSILSSTSLPEGLAARGVGVGKFITCFPPPIAAVNPGLSPGLQRPRHTGVQLEPGM